MKIFIGFAAFFFVSFAAPIAEAASGMNALIDYVKDHAESEEITKKLKESFEGLDSSKYEQIEQLIKFLEMILGKETVISMMKEDIRPFSQIPDLKAITIFGTFSLLMGKYPAQELIKNNLSAFVRAERADLEQKLEFVIDNMVPLSKRLPFTEQQEALGQIISSDFKAFVSSDFKTFKQASKKAIRQQLKSRKLDCASAF